MLGKAVQVGEESIRSVIEQFQLAGISGRDWEAALKGLADLTGSMGGQLIGLGANSAVPFNLTIGIAPESTGEFVEAGGGDPGINSRVRVGMQAAELEILDETAFDTAEDMRRHEAYGEWIRRYDISFGCLTPLIKDDRRLVGMAMMRNSAQGNIGSSQKRAFARVAPHVRAAVQAQMMLQHQNVAMLANALDALPATVFLCDGFGRVLGMSASAERLLAEGSRLTLRHGHVAAASQRDQAPLQAAIATSFGGAAVTRMNPVVVRDREGDNPLLVEAAPVPRSNPFGFGVAALVIVRQPSDDHARIAEAARALFGLTPAEANVSAQLALGRTVATIANAQNVSVGTVRTHVKRIFDKAGVNSQLELASLLARFG